MQNSHALNRIYSQAAFSQNTQDTHPSMPYAQNSEHHGESGTFGRYKMQAFQYYSFKQSQKSKEKEQEQQEEQSSYQNQSQRSCNTYKSKDDLLQKYESLCEKLKELEPNEIVFLFIEEIEENERSKREITQKNHKLSSMEQTTAQLESVLAQKRNVIRKMCETQSKNLDIIECLESKLRCADFDFAEHYQNKYRQLQGYMNEYISSSGEAQEEMYKKISLLKNQNQRLVSENQTLSRSFFEKSKLVGVMELRQLKIETALSQSREEKKLVDRQVQRLQEQNLLLRKDVQSLIQTIKGYEQFEVDLNNKSNRQFSSSLEFIRQKLNTNSNAPFQPNLLNVQGKEVSKLYFSKDNQQIEGLKTKIQLLTEQKVQLQKQNHELMEDYQSLCHKMTKLTQQNVHFQNNLEKNQKDFQRMKQMQVEADDPRSMIAAKLDRSMLGFNLCDIQESLSLSSLKLQQFSGNESLGSIGKAYALGSVSSKFETKNKQNSTGGHL